jgi:hypothetical protein
LPHRLETHRFYRLRERLLCAGVAPRHVRRYLRELGDHYDDALEAELARGGDIVRAREAAWARLGTEDRLAQSMLERPELRSTAARFPALVFGVGPALAWVAAPIAIAALVNLLPEALRRSVPPPEAASLFYTLLLVYSRLVPALLGAALLTAAADRRLRATWPVAGAAVVALLAGTLTVYIAPGQLGVTSSLLPWLAPFSEALGPRDALALGHGLLRGAGMLVIGIVGQRLVRRFRAADELTSAAG